MKKHVIISTVVAMVVLTATGCGSSGGSNKVETNSTLKPASSGAKIKPSTNHPGMGTTGVKKSIEKITIKNNEQNGDVLISLNHDKKVKVSQYFIDNDNDKKTGSTGDIKGVEYKVINYHVAANSTENGLYEVNASDTTKWIKSSKKVVVKNGTTLDSVLLNDEIIPTKYFSVTTETYNIAPNEDWTNYKSASITNDIKLAKGDAKTFKGQKGITLTVESDTKDISLTFKGKGYTKNTQIFIDSDNDSKTGYATEWALLGADYVIGEDNVLYKYSTETKDWDWAKGKSISNISKNGVIKFNISREDLGYPDPKLVIGTVLYDAKWNATNTIPDLNATNNELEYILAN